MENMRYLGEDRVGQKEEESGKTDSAVTDTKSNQINIWT